MGTCRGVDVSALQTTGAWTGDDLSFVIAKASEGQSTRDSRFASHIATARAKGLVPGGYHFGWPCQSVAAEAANYVAAVKSAAGSGVFTHWLDLEAYPDGRNVVGMTGAQIKAWATSWIAAVKKAHPGQRVGVYASLATFQAGWVPTTADAYWVAQYPVAGLTWAQAEARTRPTLPSGYGTPLVWQFASTSPALDRDLAYLSKTDLAAWAAEGGDDVALTTDDINKVANAVVAKLVAGGGVLEGSDITRVWGTDGVVPAARPPYQNDDYYKADGKTLNNTSWTAGYAVQTTVEGVRQAVALLKEVTATLGALGSGGLADQLAEQLGDLQITITKKG